MLTDSLNSVALNIVSIFSVLSGILVIISKNPIVSVLFLITLFLTIAAYLMMLGINFIGLSYLLVYVGAVSILFLFILMLINVRVSELVVSSSNSIPLAIMIGLFFNTSLNRSFPYKLESFSLDGYSMYFNLTQLLHNFYSIFNNSLSFVTSQI
jgi:NADH-ubiquinone oxidoreductase chain 6